MRSGDSQPGPINRGFKNGTRLESFLLDYREVIFLEFFIGVLYGFQSLRRLE
jgi:hypothetical protein